MFSLATYLKTYRSKYWVGSFLILLPVVRCLALDLLLLLMLMLVHLFVPTLPLLFASPLFLVQLGLLELVALVSSQLPASPSQSAVPGRPGIADPHRLHWLLLLPKVDSG